jgi:hypothetical protein
LTRAWLAQTQARWADAAADIELARSVYGDRGVCGDHTPHLLHRFAKMVWLGPALPKIDAWLQSMNRTFASGVAPPPLGSSPHG